MIILIVAGGSGTRLWPLSVSDYPKHLLTITGDKSLLQNTFERAKKITSVDKIYISTEVSHAHHVKDQLAELSDKNIIIEPARRGTMPCISNALQVISKLHGEDEPIASIWADQQIRASKAFAETFKYAGEVSQKHQRLVIVGVEPESPSVKFGYIEKNGQVEGEPFLHDVKSFTEKPDHYTAQKYIESGDYLWNAGYFVAPYKVFKNSIAKYADAHWTDQLNKLANLEGDEADKVYLEYQDEAIDTALIEKSPDLLVVPASFDWMDVGSFDDVHRVSAQDENGNAYYGQDIQVIDSEQVYVRNDEDKPVAVVGMDNVVVVNTKNGILVMRIDQSQKVKQVVKNLNENNG